MNDVDVSKVGLYSEFPPLVDYQTVTLQFTIPGESGSVASPAGTNTVLVYDQTHSTTLDKAQGIADVRIHYDGMRAVGIPTGLVDSANPPSGGDFKDDITWNVRSTVADFCSALSGYRVNGKNVSFVQMGQDPNSVISAVSNPYYALNFFVWFDDGRLYCRATLNRGSISLLAGYNYNWTGGTVTLTAKVSLLPY